MALLAEEIVEEWLNREGYFTIRGVKLGVHEMDVLAVRIKNSYMECRQIEVQASVRPVSYVTRVPKAVQKKTGRSAASAKMRGQEELRDGVAEWIEKKFNHPEKKKVRDRLAPGPWSRELVVGHVKYPDELELITKAGVKVHRLTEVIASLKRGRALLAGAAGADLVDLVTITAT